MHQRQLSQQMDSVGSGQFISGNSEVDEGFFKFVYGNSGIDDSRHDAKFGRLFGLFPCCIKSMYRFPQKSIINNIVDKSNYIVDNGK
jgi:hypothetical protein